jgi:hypothetical protein
MEKSITVRFFQDRDWRRRGGVYGPKRRRELSLLGLVFAMDVVVYVVFARGGQNSLRTAFTSTLSGVLPAGLAENGGVLGRGCGGLEKGHVDLHLTMLTSATAASRLAVS